MALGSSGQCCIAWMSILVCVALRLVVGLNRVRGGGGEGGGGGGGGVGHFNFVAQKSKYQSV